METERVISLSVPAVSASVKAALPLWLTLEKVVAGKTNADPPVLMG
jgi:hypothetical protein